MDMMLLYVIQVLLIFGIVYGQEDVTCSIPDAQKCLQTRLIDMNKIAADGTITDNYKRLCLAQVRPDHVEDCFNKWTKICPMEEARGIRTEWLNMNDQILGMCQKVCPNILDMSSCKNMTVTSELKEEKFETFCRSFNHSITCAQEVLYDCELGGFEMYSDLLSSEPKIMEYWRYICNSGCSNIDDTIGVIAQCAISLKGLTKDNLCVGHNKFKTCVLDNPIVCDKVMLLIKYKYRRYRKIEAVCSTTTTSTTVPTTTVTVPTTTVTVQSSTSSTTIPTTSVTLPTTTPSTTVMAYTTIAIAEETHTRKPTTIQDIYEEQVVPDWITDCLTTLELNILNSQKTNIDVRLQEVLITMKLESCLHANIDSLEEIGQVWASLPKHIRHVYHTSKLTGKGIVLDELANCQVERNEALIGCSTQNQSSTPCNSASSINAAAPMTGFLAVCIWLHL